MNEEEDGPPNRELYALLHISLDTSVDDVRKSYRQWAQIYHPDKIQAPHMKEAAMENFRRICEAYEILSDENKRNIYDIYGMEGLNSGLELGTKLSKAEEVMEELEKLLKLREQQKAVAHFLPSGAIVARMSLPDFFLGHGFMKGMAMTSSIQSQISKRNTLSIGGNVAANENSGGGGATLVFGHQLSPVSSIEFVGSAGLNSFLGVQTSHQLSQHLSATMGLTMSLKKGLLNLSNVWTRQMSETASGNIELALGLIHLSP